IDRTRARQAQAALRESEERFRRLAEATWEAILIHDGDRVLDCNTVLEHLTACPREELIGRSVFDFLLPEQRDLVRTMIAAGTEQPYEVRVVRRDGVTFPVEVRGRNAILDGRVVRVAAIRDLSRQRAQESALRETEARMRAVVETTVDGILTVDEHGNIETHNPAVESIFGFEPGELEGRGLATLLADPPAGSLDQFASSVELMGRRKDGVIIPIYVVISEVRLEDRRLFTAIIRDLTKHKQLTERITYLANHDPLTELPNRTLFAERLDRILAQMPGGEAAGLAVLVVDVDGFSAINDHYGHEAANKLLQTLAGRLRQWLPEGNEPARIGTDHFAVALPGLTENSEVLQAAAAIRAAVGEPVPLMPQVTLNVTCRIGAVFFPRNGNNGVELLRAAELALSSAKRGEEGVGLLNAGHSASKAERQALARDIARAIEQDEFELFYQPQVTLETRQLIGSEALI
ncbi:MAG: PAS domain S-box protein, partial [Rhodospirillales bacterium]|nr:PAS domain S-box protein [Rhodospirillales bacterium]